MRISAAVLAGGHSRRMGQDKARLRLRGNRVLLQRQIDLLRKLGVCEVIVSLRYRQHVPVPAGVRIVRDPGNAGPLGGVVAVLQATKTPRVLVLPVDMPLLTVPLLRRLVGAALINEEIGVVPATIQGPQLLPSLLPRALLPLAQGQLAGGEDFALRRLAATAIASGKLCLLRVPSWDEPCFVGWNTPVESKVSRRT